MLNIGERIRELRTIRDLSTSQLAKLVGVNQSFISQLENKQSGVKIETLYKICSALGITLSDFFADTNDTYDTASDTSQLTEILKQLPKEERGALLNYLQTRLRN